MRWNLRPLLLVGPALILLVFFFAALTTVLSLSMRNAAGDFTLANFVSFAADGHFRTYLWRSVRIASYVTLIVLLAGYPIAYVMSRGSRRFATFITLTLAIQFFSIYVVKMYGWMLMLGNNGVINRGLKAMGLIDAPVKLMYNELGVAIGLFASALPLMVFPISSVLQNVSSRYEEAARSLGATPLQAFLRVTLPLSAPGVVGGTVLSFVFCFTAYLTPSLLGGSIFKMIGNLIYDQAIVGFNYALSGTAAVVTLLISLTVVFGINSIGARLLPGGNR
ncbi:ABC transporter permease [Ferrovibrio sp. MS7]|jgi:putative spermidine/putrescine transport system permease protein|uniref:ABC transporter permease n=1 Tax=Ferrovibrio TaxID=1231242 RepID=UPI00313482DC